MAAEQRAEGLDRLHTDARAAVQRLADDGFGRVGRHIPASPNASPRSGTAWACRYPTGKRSRRHVAEGLARHGQHLALEVIARRQGGMAAPHPAAQSQRSRVRTTPPPRPVPGPSTTAPCPLAHGWPPPLDDRPTKSVPPRVTRQRQRLRFEIVQQDQHVQHQGLGHRLCEKSQAAFVSTTRSAVTAVATASAAPRGRSNPLEASRQTVQVGLRSFRRASMALHRQHLDVLPPVRPAPSHSQIGRWCPPTSATSQGKGALMPEPRQPPCGRQQGRVAMG